LMDTQRASIHRDLSSCSSVPANLISDVILRTCSQCSAAACARPTQRYPPMPCCRSACVTTVRRPAGPRIENAELLICHVQPHDDLLFCGFPRAGCADWQLRRFEPSSVAPVGVLPAPGLVLSLPPLAPVPAGPARPSGRLRLIPTQQGRWTPGWQPLAAIQAGPRLAAGGGSSLSSRFASFSNTATRLPACPAGRAPYPFTLLRQLLGLHEGLQGGFPGDGWPPVLVARGSGVARFLFRHSRSIEADMCKASSSGSF
jgi:hypothetical protein